MVGLFIVPGVRRDVNRHGIATLLALVAIFAVLAVTTGAILAAFFVPTLAFDVVGEAGLLAATLVWFALVLGAVFGQERLFEWLRYRYELSDQSPDRRPER